MQNKNNPLDYSDWYFVKAMLSKKSKYFLKNFRIKFVERIYGLYVSVYNKYLLFSFYIKEVKKSV